MRRIFLASVAALAAATVGVYAAFVRDLAGARRRLRGRSDTIEMPFGPMEYATLGEGDPLLIVHGAGGGFDQGIEMAGELAGRGFRLIVPSRFGYLRSALPEQATTALQADAYAELLDRLGAGEAVAVAISAGAWSALQFAIRHPQRCRALVLIVPADYLPAGTSVQGGRLVTAFLNSDFVAWACLKAMQWGSDRLVTSILGTDCALVQAATRDEKARAQRILDQLLPVRPRLRGMRFDIATAAGHIPLPLGRIACPVLTISARDDRFGTAARAEFIAANVTDGRVIVFPTGGHALLDRYADALREVVAFIHALRRQH